MASKKEQFKPYQPPMTERQRSSDYEIFYEHERTDGSFKPLVTLEEEYVELTDKLIYRMTHGMSATVNGERMNVKPNIAIFLDKSARPLSWLTSELWNTLAPEPGEAEIPEKPDFKFLNIDRKQWLKPEEILAVAKGEANIHDMVAQIPEDQIIALRSIFSRNHDGSFDAPNDLDNQVIMVIDEVKSSGATLQFAQSMIGRAFPSSIVTAEYWMENQYKKGGAVGNSDLPVWYKHNDKNPEDIDSHRGRGVANRESNPAILAEFPERRFMSRPWSTPDPLSLALRRDIKKLSGMVGTEVNYIPYYERSDESIEKRAEAINEGRTYVEIMLARKALKELYQNGRR